MLLGMSKRGDPYLRTMLIHGARSVVCLTRNADRPAYSAKSSRRTSGRRLAIVSSERAAPVGFLRPCSQPSRVLADTPSNLRSASASTSWNT
jgi:hypothetical protein